MASKKRAAPTRPRASSRAHGVVLERIESQMQIVVESVTSLSSQIDAKLSALESRLSERISILEQVVRQNSADVRALQVEVATLRRDFEHREELARMRALEERVARVEAKLGITSLT